ncbi:MAG: Mur ligase family protein [Candidatus Latescibacteria bacterium]|nr:Mur ligase family protein [Candidatus Latescibacterota bacterium]
MEPQLLRTAAITLGKTITRTVQTLRIGGGSAAPGYFASKLYPRLTTDLIRQFPDGCVIVTGTNGKTTTSALLAGMLRQAGHVTLHNFTGSNMMQGVASVLVQAASLSGEIDASLGLFEIDEATLPRAIAELSPRMVVMNNLFRDQLDRYGEIDTVARHWRRSFEKMPADHVLIVNADDPLLSGLINGAHGRLFYFGIEDDRLAMTKVPRSADSMFCQRCGSSLTYRRIILSHLGDYHCPACGWERPKPSVYAINIEATPVSSRFRIVTPVGPLDVHLNLPGVYNVYNAVGAVTAALAMGVNPATIRACLELATTPFGRGEQIKTGDRTVRLMLAKNPTGYNEVLRTVLFDPLPQHYFLLLNDRIADGRDVSWIWDVDFESLAGRTKSVVVSGTRAADLALRLKHAGVDVTAVDSHVEDAFHRALEFVPTKGRLWTLATYTAMLDFRRVMLRLGLVKGLWE